MSTLWIYDVDADLLNSLTDLESSDDEISEIQAEIAHLSTCSSAHVTKYYGSFVRGWRLWIVMEYLAGGSCLDLVRWDLPKAWLQLTTSLAETWAILRSADCHRLPRAPARIAISA